MASTPPDHEDPERKATARSPGSLPRDYPDTLCALETALIHERRTRTEAQPLEEELARLRRNEQTSREAIEALERKLADVQKTKPQASSEPLSDTIGVALSGGGIRSATFALGLFQLMAKKKLLRRVDYLSTVSGGGYFGAFFTALFARLGTTGWRDVEAALESDSAQVEYLRRNGRYLAPAGTHDLLLGVAVLLRNWIALLVMVGSLLIGVLVALEWLPMLVVSEIELGASLLWFEDYVQVGTGYGVWLSGWLWLSLFIVVSIAAPMGWAYFILGHWHPYTGGRLRRLGAAIKPGLVAAQALVIAIAFQRYRSGDVFLGAWLVQFSVLAVAVEIGAERWLGIQAAMNRTRASTARPRWTAMFAAVTIGFVFSLSPVLVVWRLEPGALVGSMMGSVAIDWASLFLLTACLRLLLNSFKAGGEDVDLDHFPRHTVSTWLKSCLVVFAVLLLLGLVQSTGRTLFAYMAHDLGWLLTALGGALGSAASVARRLVVKLGQEPDGKRSRGWSALLQYAAGGIVALAVLIAASTTAARLSYGLLPSMPPPAEEGTPVFRPEVIEAARAAIGPDAEERALVWTLVLLGASLVFGFSHRLLNNSTHLPLYSARITRTFLGASNSQRIAHSNDAQREAATHLMQKDDIGLDAYFQHPDAGKSETECKSPYSKGAPLHLINVTINETVDGRSDMHQPDAKGLGLAVGPCGLSAGVRHHAVFRWSRQLDPELKIFPAQGFRIFKVDVGRPFPKERPSLGKWMGISGAAFSTGLGWRTNVGLSFLAGITNVRLGHWWRPGVELPLTFSRIFGSVCWVQQYLAREFAARFPGTANSLWYLSDGGHFENTGAYELLRRRVKQVLLVDAEADPSYEFEGLAHLVRKARIDFGIEIEFLNRDDARFIATLEPEVLDAFGSLEELRRGSWNKKVHLVRDGSQAPRLDEQGYTFDEVKHDALSRAHAAVAVIRYPEANCEGTLIYVKPTLTGTESIDVARYHTEHPAFPQETTGDQFFDEAQWESYRKLGEHIAGRLFGESWPLSKAR